MTNADISDPPEYWIVTYEAGVCVLVGLYSGERVPLDDHGILAVQWYGRPRPASQERDDGQPPVS